MDATSDVGAVTLTGNEERAGRSCHANLGLASFAQGLPRCLDYGGRCGYGAATLDTLGPEATA